MDALGGAIDGLVQHLYSPLIDGFSAVQEPDITSRICQRVEDSLNGKRIGPYGLRVSANSLPDRGPNSLEKITGADLYLSISVDGPDGFDKGLFIQAKYDRNVNREELLGACDRMTSVVSTGSYVWIYEPDGVKVLTPHQVRRMRGNSLEGINSHTVSGLTGRILDCHAGNKKWGVPKTHDRQLYVRNRLRDLRIRNGLDLNLEKDVTAD